MLGYMNEASWEITQRTKKVTFWSRSRQELWTKGETSNNYLHLVSWALDCDEDSLLIKVNPDGPTCHTGEDTCWKESNLRRDIAFIEDLEKVIDGRYINRSEKSYTASLFDKGTNKIAQKVGEEAVELVIEAMDNNDDLFKGEAADLLFHYLVLLRDRNMSLKDIVELLKSRHKVD